MQRYRLEAFGLKNLHLEEVSLPKPGPGELRVELAAVSLNFRDRLVIEGLYDPHLTLPCTPVSDGAGLVSAVGEGVSEYRVGDRVMSHFVAGWQEGPFEGRYRQTTLGTPGPGLATEQVVLPQGGVVPMPARLDFAKAATLPIAAVTAWNALVVEGRLLPGQTVLTLGTGGVSIFALQIAAAFGARVIVTSSSDEKLERAKALGAELGINYLENEDWEKAVLAHTHGEGVDLVVENGGAGTLGRSLRAVRPGGTIAMLGALSGLQAKLDLAPILMKRLRVQGIFVGSRTSFLEMLAFFAEHAIAPVIDRTFELPDLGSALGLMQAGGHFGKIVLRF